MRIFENQEIIGKNKTEYSYEALFFYLNSHFKKQMKSLLIILLFIGPITIYYLVMQLFGQRNYELGLGMFFVLSLIIILSIFNLKVQAKKLSKRLIDSQIGSIKNVIFYKDYFSIEATFVNGYSFNVYEYSKINTIYHGSKYIAFVTYNETNADILDLDGFFECDVISIISRIKEVNRNVNYQKIRK